MENFNKFLSHLCHPDLIAIHKIQHVLLRELQNYMYQHNFIQLMPLLTSPITDPLNHQVYPAEIKYDDKCFKLTASMIFHKQLALVPKNIEKIFIIAPNIRLELASKKTSDNHLIEFSQFDFEIKDVGIEVVMDFIEDLYVYVFNMIEKYCSSELILLGRKLPKLQKPFEKFSTEGIPPDEIEDFCTDLSSKAIQPCFITSFKREFYDKEDSDKRGVYLNFDLVYPEGYGEALSGAEREYVYEDIIRRMEELDMDRSPFSNYLEVAKRGLLPRTAGSGIGIQRLLKFICGKRAIKEVCMFDRSLMSDFIF